MEAWRYGGSHTSSFNPIITHSHSSGKICNSEQILDSQLVPWWFEERSDRASFAEPGSAQQAVKRESPTFPPRGCNASVRSMDAAVRAMHSNISLSTMKPTGSQGEFKTTQKKC